MQGAATRRNDRSAAFHSRLAIGLEHLVLAMVAFVPQLLADPGVVTSDTKSFLYLDPGTFLRQSASMWDPTVALGTVTHEQVGYLFPMGPFYWVMSTLHVSTWVAQRLWVGAIIFAAGAGVLYLTRHLGMNEPARGVAALAFCLSPYLLQYVGRISVILLPWAGLPWMVAFIAQAARTRGWRYPALFALVVAAVGGINASSLVYVGIAPVLWLPYAVFVSREITRRDAWRCVWRTGVLSLAVSLYWIVGLEIEGAYGVNVLKYTETVSTVSQTSVASEVLRGLGYWYFYGTDRMGAWMPASVSFTQDLWLLASSFAVPVLAVVAASLLRWTQRSYFVLLVLVGMICAVGAFPYSNPSFFGQAVRSFMLHSTVGLALRSTDRATPLVILGLAVLLGGGVAALSTSVPRIGILVAIGAIAVIAAANPTLWDGGTVVNGFTQPDPLPSAVRQAAAALNNEARGTRVLAIPGSDFAAYRYGDTVDSVYPGLLTRPFVTDEQLVQGSLATNNVIAAINDPLQNGTPNLDALAPMARLLSAGDILLQNNLAYEHYDQPLPQQLAAELATPPTGLGTPTGYGAPVPNVSLLPEEDEQAEATSPSAPWPSPIEVFPVSDPRPIVRAEPASAPLVVDGDANGVAEAAGIGLLAGNPTILYGGTLDSHPAQLQAAVRSGATIVVTDTNQKQAHLWNQIEEDVGYIEPPKQSAPSNPNNFPVNLFPGAPSDAQTTADITGVSSVTASDYGYPATYLPEDRPAAALDGNDDTAWEVGTGGSPDGQWWQMTTVEPIRANQLTVVQPLVGDPNQWITRITLRFDGGRSLSVDLGPSSRASEGQQIHFSARTFSTLRITVERTNLDGKAPGPGQSAVGLAEVRLANVSAHEVISMPSDVLDAAGTASLQDRLLVVMNRVRVQPIPPRSDPQTTISRTIFLPTARSFTVTGTASISAQIPDDAIDRLLGRPGSTGNGIVAYSSGRLPGDLAAGAQAALDSNPDTAWINGFGANAQAGSWIQVTAPRAVSFDHLTLQVVADGQHSVPTRVTIAAGGEKDTLSLPPIADGRRQGTVVNVPLTFPTLSGTSIRVTFDKVRLEYTRNANSTLPIALPLSIAELGIPGVTIPSLPATLPGTCTENLLRIDGKPVWLAVTGSTTTALAGDELPVELCGPDAGGITLGAGTHDIESANGADPGVTGLSLGQNDTGFNLDALTLDSAPDGGAENEAMVESSNGTTPSLDISEPGATEGATGSATAVPAPHVSSAPRVTVTGQSATVLDVRVSGITSSTPFWLVLGESINQGWEASSPTGHSLGSPELIDSFANGWLLRPDTTGFTPRNGVLLLTLRWTPQHNMTVALMVSGFALLVCLALALWPRFRRRRRVLHTASSSGDPALKIPLFATPLHPSGNRLGTGGRILTALLVGMVGTALTTPVIGLSLAVGTYVASQLPWGRVLLVTTSISGVAAAGAWTVLTQAMDHVPAGGAWAEAFTTSGRLAWVGVVFLAADAVLDTREQWIYRRRRIAPERRDTEDRASSTNA
jgi:hypothetical protein